MSKNPYQNLCGAQSETAANIHYEISNHPAARYVNFSVIYNRTYHESNDKCGNLYVARTKAALVTLAAMDEVARVLHLMPATESTPLPELVLDDMLRSLGFAPDTQLVQKVVIHTRSPRGTRRSKAEVKQKNTTKAKQAGTKKKVPSNTPLLSAVVTPKSEDKSEDTETTHLFKPRTMSREERERNISLNDVTSLIARPRK